jgi:hypothetical protein
MGEVLNTPAEVRKMGEDIVSALETYLETPVIAAIGSLTAATGADLTIQAATGKEIKMLLTDAAGARKFEVLDSGSAVVFSVDSDGNVTATTVAAAFTGNLTATTGADLQITSVSGKDIKTKLTDNAGARKFLLLDSDNATVFSIDSDGNIIATQLTGNLVGNVTGNSSGTHTGDVVDDAAATVTYANGHADYTLSATEMKSRMIKLTNADQAANLILPNAYRAPYIIKNGSGAAITCKGSSGTGVAIANGKYALVTWDGTNYIRITPDT